MFLVSARVEDDQAAELPEQFEDGDGDQAEVFDEGARRAGADER
ncbi:hypothetical protein [Nonomuraea sp. NPDC049400]